MGAAAPAERAQHVERGASCTAPLAVGVAAGLVGAAASRRSGRSALAKGQGVTARLGEGSASRKAEGWDRPGTCCQLLASQAPHHAPDLGLGTGGGLRRSAPGGPQAACGGGGRWPCRTAQPLNEMT